MIKDGKRVEEKKVEVKKEEFSPRDTAVAKALAKGDEAEAERVLEDRFFGIKGH